MSLSHFEILDKIGEGSFSTVYKVLRKSDSKIYALKKVSLARLTDKEKKHALNEIRFIASINHPNVISFKQAFYVESENALCLVMEFADSGDLYQRIQNCITRKVHLKEKLVWSIFLQITQGLKAIHDLGILHRDLKSANVFLNKDGSVKLGDLNVSKIAKNGFLKTQTGTPYYSSPEVWNDSKYSNKSDIWSLGCVLYETLCLKPPFRGQGMDEVCKNVLKGKYSSIPKVYSVEIGKVLAMLLSFDPLRRPSCKEILDLPEVKFRFENKALKVNDSQLLEAIKMPLVICKNSLSLPRANYEEVRENIGRMSRNSPECLKEMLRSVRSEVTLPQIRVNGNCRDFMRPMYRGRAKNIGEVVGSPRKYSLSPEINSKKLVNLRKN